MINSARVITSSIFSGSSPSLQTTKVARPHRSSSRIPLDTCQSISQSVVMSMNSDDVIR